MVTTVAARQGDMGVYVPALGVVTPVNTVQVRSRVDGQLMKVAYTEGQMVSSNDVLVELDPRPYEAVLKQAEGQSDRDRALLENATVDLHRYELAFSSNAIPKQQLDTQKAIVHQYEGLVKLDDGQVDSARLNLAYAHICAPIPGRVGFRMVDPGNIVHATDTSPLATITQVQPITVVFGVNADYLATIQEQIRQGEKLKVDAYDSHEVKKLATGVVQTLDNSIDVTTDTIKVKAWFTNTDLALFPNQFVNVRMLVSTRRGVTLVPTSSVQHNGQSAFLYVVQDNQTNKTAVIRPVTLGSDDEQDTAVEGIEPGSLVVVDNFNRLQDGVKVEVRKPGEDSGQAQRKGGRGGAPDGKRGGKPAN